jgi:hypothetical protein
MRHLGIILVLAAVAAAYAATGASGHWTGFIVVDRPGSNETVRTPVDLDLTERNGAIEGKIGRKGESDRTAIRNGKAQGASVTFEASSAETAGPMRFTLKRDGDKLEGQMKGPTDDGEIEAKVLFTREK